MHHCLLVASLVIAELRHLLQSLTNPSDISMTKDAKASSKKGLLYPVALHVLVLKKCNDGMSRCQPLVCLRIRCSLPCKRRSPAPHPSGRDKSRPSRKS